jgi:DNA repair protein RecN (Recombination protein N)
LKAGAVSENFLGLEEITIRNLGVIESAHIEFTPGLNVLTGETGAGKTMVLTALGLLLGGKSDAERVRTGADRLVTTGRFAISESVASDLNEDDVVIEDGTLLISRTVTSDGKSRIHLGGVAGTLSRTAEISENLIEIHAQSSTQRLAKPAYIRSVVDAAVDNQALLSQMSSTYQIFTELRLRIAQLEIDQKNRDEEIAKISEFLTSFTAVSPKVNELIDIESELAKLSNVDELQQSTTNALNILERDDLSVTSSLVSAKRALEHVSGKDLALDEIATTLGDCIFSLEESLSALHRYGSALDADPVKLDYLQNRKSAINSLIKKHGRGSDRDEAFTELLERAEIAQDRIADLEGGADRIADLRSELAEAFIEMKTVALKLEKSRMEAAGDLSRRITEEIHSLSMPHASITISVASSDPEDPASYSQHGINDLMILFTSHTGSEPGLLSKYASGGELSRVMLAIEVVLARDSQIPTYVFDEVDSGVGGKAAMEVGKRLAQLADNAQVIVVTHLAQVAVWANNHLVVTKNEAGSIGVSNVKTLTSEERRVEIARMLSGQEESTTAQEHAQELLEMVSKRVIS